MITVQPKLANTLSEKEEVVGEHRHNQPVQSNRDDKVNAVRAKIVEQSAHFSAFNNARVLAREFAYPCVGTGHNGHFAGQITLVRIRLVACRHTHATSHDVFLGTKKICPQTSAECKFLSHLTALTVTTVRAAENKGCIGKSNSRR